MSCDEAQSRKPDDPTYGKTYIFKCRINYSSLRRLPRYKFEYTPPVRGRTTFKTCRPETGTRARKTSRRNGDGDDDDYISTTGVGSAFAFLFFASSLRRVVDVAMEWASKG